MKKKIYFIFLLIVVGLFGCNIGEGTETEEEIVMTNEQVIIARKLGMSTNYEELSNADKRKVWQGICF